MALLLQGDPGIPSSIEKVFVVEMTHLRGEEPGGDVTLSLPWPPSQVGTSDLLEGPVNALASSGGVVTIPVTLGATLTVLLVDP